MKWHGKDDGSFSSQSWLRRKIAQKCLETLIITELK